jgi:hypothetical protein
MAVPLTINSFLLGYRTTEAKSIPHNPFYNALYDRDSAETAVAHYGFPVLRNSSRAGFYALTFYCWQRQSIIHSLIRQNADLSITVLTDTLVACEHYANVYNLLTLAIQTGRRPAPLVEIAPSLVPILPAAVSAYVGDASRGFILPSATTTAAVATTATTDEDPTH